jgi:hypothetical protein
MAQSSGTGSGPIPAARKDDTEDVAWALSTAEAMYARGDRGDALKWLRRAAESASEAQADDRALELAKAAADLATLVGPTSSMAPPPVRSSNPPQAGATPPPAVRLPPPAPAPTIQTPAAPPVPAASLRPMSPPAAPSAPAPVSPRPASAPAPAPSSSPARGVPPAPPSRPGGGLAPRAPMHPGLTPTPIAPRVGEGRRARRSRPDIQIARTPDEMTQTVQDMAVPLAQPRRRGRASRPALEEITGQVPPPPPSSAPAARALGAAPPPPSSAPAARALGAAPPPPPSSSAPLSPLPSTVRTEDMDAWPTQSLGPGDDLEDAPDEKTRIGVPAYEASAKMATEARSTPSLEGEARPRCSQAVRVLVWRTADGVVHVAPHGTRVSAITVDAMLVAIDPDADLAAWLSGK